MAIALPCLPGGASRLREIAGELSGSRREEFADFHRRVGLSGEKWFLQQTPQGELLVLTLDGDPLGAMQKLGMSDHPFDVWFRDAVKEVHGVDFTQPMQGPPPEQVFAG
ncbi:MAG TPA: hypothetical protein VF137_11630 [Candidatus Dormibacteraeota bacterium]